MNSRADPEDYAFFGAKPLFDTIRSTSNLVRPDFARFLEYSRQFLEAGNSPGGQPVERLLEQRLAEFHHTQHCVSLCSGFWALVLAIKAVALPGRTEVIIPSLTYRRLADLVAWAGLVPHFCEVDPDRLCITAKTARQCISEDTALIVGVHPIVNCCDAEGLETLSVETGIPLLFDSVESVYETINHRKVGSFGLAECFSLHASKLLNGFEGGYVTTNNRSLADRIGALGGDLLVGADDAPEGAMNARQNQVHAAMALAALDGIEQQVDSNRRRYYRYRAGLADVRGLRLLEFDETDQCSYKNIVVELLDSWPISRDFTLDLLHKENMLCRPYYSPPLHKRAMTYPSVCGDLRLTERLAERFLTLPCGYFVTEDDVGQICEYLHSLCMHGAALTARAATRS